jgi:hypothetical protein
MIRIVILLAIAQTATLALSFDEPPRPNNREAALQLQQLQERYTDRLWHEVLPRLKEANGLSQDDLAFSTAPRVWKEVFGPHRQLLRDAAREILARLSGATAIDETKYSALGEARGLTVGTVAPDNETVAKLEPFLQITCWNPVVAADRPCALMFGSLLGPREAAKRALLNTVAPPVWQAIDRDSDHPKLVRRMGPEIVIVELEFRREGFYYPVRSRWLRLKDESEKGARHRIQAR